MTEDGEAMQTTTIHRGFAIVVACLLTGCEISRPTACSAQTPPEDEDLREKCQNFNVTAVDQPSAHLACGEHDTAREWAGQLEIFRLDRDATRNLAEKASDSDTVHRRITGTMRQYVSHQKLEVLRESTQSLVGEDHRVVYRYIAENKAPVPSKDSSDAGLGLYASPDRYQPGDGIWVALVVDGQSAISLDGATSAELMIPEALDSLRLEVGLSDAASEQLETLSRKAVGERIAFVYDDLVVSAPEIHEPLAPVPSFQVMPPFGPTTYKRKLPQKMSE